MIKNRRIYDKFEYLECDFCDNIIQAQHIVSNSGWLRRGMWYAPNHPKNKILTYCYKCAKEKL